MERSDPGGLSPARLVAAIVGLVIVDAVTKYFAVDLLVPVHVPHPIIGDVVRLTLVYNPGAAFGLHLGPWSRLIFIGLTFLALAVVWSLYRSSAPSVLSRTRVLALAAVAGGAIGNLVDRVRSPRGVVDFMDIGVGDWRWPTFNVADTAVTIGALTLAVVLWREDAEAARARAAQVDSPSPQS